MESSLGQQISQRGFDTSRINSLMNTSNNDYFGDWKEKSDDLYKKQLTKYSSKLQEEVARKIGDEGQGSAILSNIPTAYAAGKGAYKFAPKFVRKGADKIGRKIGLKNPNEKNVKSNANEMKSTIKNTNEEEYKAPIETETTTEAIDHTPQPVEGLSSVKTIEEPLEQVVDHTPQPVEGLSVKPVETLETTAKEVGEDIGEKEIKELPLEGALDDTGIGAPVAGAIAVGVALGTGIKDLVEKHKKPKEPDNPTVPPPMTNRYSLSTSILPNSSNLNSTPSVMTF